MSDIDIKFNCDVTAAVKSFSQIKTAAAESLQIMRVDLGKFSQYSNQESVKRVKEELKTLKQKEGMYKLHYSNLSAEEKKAYQEAIRHQKMVLDQAKVVANEEVAIYKNKLAQMNSEAKKFADQQRAIMKSIAGEMSGMMGGVRSALSFGGVAGVAGFMGQALGDDRQLSKHIRSIRGISDDNDRKVDLRREITSASNLTGVNKNELARGILTAKKSGASINTDFISELSQQIMMNPELDVEGYSKAIGRLRGSHLSDKQSMDVMTAMQIQTRAPGAGFTAEQLAEDAISTASFAGGYHVGGKKSTSENIASTAGLMQILSPTSKDPAEIATGIRRAIEFSSKKGWDLGDGNIQESMNIALGKVREAGGGDVAKGTEALKMDERAGKLFIQLEEQMKGASTALTEHIDIQAAVNTADKERKEQQVETWQSIDKSFNEIKNTVAEALQEPLKDFAKTLADNKGSLKSFFEYIGKLAAWAAKNPFAALLLLNVDKLATVVNTLNNLRLAIPTGGVPGGGGSPGMLTGLASMLGASSVGSVGSVTAGGMLGAVGAGTVSAGVALGAGANVLAHNIGITSAPSAGEIASMPGDLLDMAAEWFVPGSTKPQKKQEFMGDLVGDELSKSDDALGSDIDREMKALLQHQLTTMQKIDAKTPVPASTAGNTSAHFQGTHAFVGTTSFGSVVIMHHEDRSGVL